MGYYIDLSNTSIEEYKVILKSFDLLPSWKILEESIDERMNTISDCGIENLDELLNALKTKNRVETFANKSGLPVDYLSVLRIVINGYRPKPTKFSDFPCLDYKIVVKLERFGIRNTLQLYDLILTMKNRKDLSEQTDISMEQVETLTSLTDLSRIKWVNHTFACMLYEVGYRFAPEIAEATKEDMYEKVKALNFKKKILKHNIGMKDMERVIESAKTLEFEIEY